MNCFDCMVETPRASTTVPSPASAVGVCSRCGAGICGTHLHVTSESLSSAPDTSRASPAARRLTCSVCYEAEQAADQA
ncbi:DUF2180 family protein [Streptomyces sp. NPDC005813]|uniref:DUF2180 family protein n=1 Tax=Streptomyces sp. NPDC005813 TaxID=3155592 RepID=UPI00340E3A83